MEKTRAIELLGGTISSAAQEIGCSYQAVRQWPEVLTRRIADRVEAALARRNDASRRRVRKSKSANAVS